jgi:site-specific recombinase XerD
VPIAAAVWEQYSAWCQTDGRLAPRTAEKSARYLRFLERRGLQLDHGAFERDVVIRFITDARDRNRSPQTINLWVTNVNRWRRFLGEPWPKIPPLRHHHVADVPAPTKTQAMQLWNASWTDRSINARNRAMISVLLDKGVRRQELVDLNRQDFVQTRAGPSLIIRHGKGDRERTVPLTEATAERIRTYVRDHRASSDPQALFTTVRGRVSHAFLGRIIEEAGRKTGMPWISCHKLRHFATDDMLDRGVSIQSVAEVLGHQDITTTMIYRSRKLNRQAADREVRARDRGRFSPRAPRPSERRHQPVQEAA